MKQFYTQTPRARRTIILRRWITLALLSVSLLPLFVVFGGAAVVFSGIVMDQSVAQKETNISARAAAIDLFLDERRRALEIAAKSFPLDALRTRDGLSRLFVILKNANPEAFVDLGVIDQHGNHLAYVGPYDLRGKNYLGTDWFTETLAHGGIQSDVFLGFRGEPHMVIAVVREDVDGRYILRATVNNDTLAGLLRNSEQDRAGDAFIVNRRGKYQTAPKEGEVLSDAGLSELRPHRGVRVRRVLLDGVPTLQSTIWLNRNRWVLVARQAESAIMAPVRDAILSGTLVALVGVLLTAVTTWMATSYLVDKIDRAVFERDAVARDLMRSAKLASLGELATGLAHEINNPLAVMNVEHTNIEDALDDARPEGCLEARETLIRDAIARCRKQIERCSSVTMKMLQFGRQTPRLPSLVPIGPILEESVGLMRRQHKARDISFHCDIPSDLPMLLVDGNELEQVFVNILTNAIQSIENEGSIHVTALRAADEVSVVFDDSGCGIPPESMEHIFQPFYTTKPVGEGTGLGLSVCHGIVQSFGGAIRVSSAEGHGTTVAVSLPIPEDPGGEAQ